MGKLGAQPGKARVPEANTVSGLLAKGLMLHLLVEEGTALDPQSPLCGLEAAVHHTRAVWPWASHFVFRVPLASFMEM